MSVLPRAAILFLFILQPDWSSAQSNEPKPLFRIRTITAGVNLKSLDDLGTIREAATFLAAARKRFESAGYEVQTLRIATQSLLEFGPLNAASLTKIKAMDVLLDSRKMIMAIGPVQLEDRYDPHLPGWIVKLMQQTEHISCSMVIASERGIQMKAARGAAETILAISRETPAGEGNFRFTAIANVPANAPFFPAAFHVGEPSFGIGLESPGLLIEAFKGAKNFPEAKGRLKKLMTEKLQGVEQIALKVSRDHHRSYDGIDTSPAPGLDASIGEAIEVLTGQRFGHVSTLSACAAITQVIQNIDIRRCGFSGLMLPIVEDKILAKRALQKTFTVSELLLYSSVCGTGLDVVPIAGDTPVEKIERLLIDVASLSHRLSRKPLSARLFPIPGKRAGEPVSFDNPYLTDSIVMPLD